jgi:phage/plasmid-associated DNA primase
VIAGRFLFLRTRRSFFGREDSKLIEKLLPELPQIACWAAKGYQDLIKMDGFVDPPYAEELRSQLRDIASPIHLFAEERCEFDASFRVDKDRLYDSFKQWCEAAGMKGFTPSKGMFCRDLYAAFPGVHDGRGRSSKNVKSRPHVVKGLRLRGLHFGGQPSDIV